MTLTTRSLLLAVLACFSMGLFAKSMMHPGDGRSWITNVFLVTTFALGVGGCWLGLQGARQQRSIRAWLAPGINVFLIVVFLAFLWLLERGLARLG